MATEGPFDVSDKFRIDIFIDKKLVGRKQVTATLVRRKKASATSATAAAVNVCVFTVNYL